MCIDAHCLQLLPTTRTPRGSQCTGRRPAGKRPVTHVFSPAFLKQIWLKNLIWCDDHWHPRILKWVFCWTYLTNQSIYNGKSGKVPQPLTANTFERPLAEKNKAWIQEAGAMGSVLWIHTFVLQITRGQTHPHVPNWVREYRWIDSNPSLFSTHQRRGYFQCVQ